jgi:hypothetical protein
VGFGVEHYQSRNENIEYGYAHYGEQYSLLFSDDTAQDLNLAWVPEEF